MGKNKLKKFAEIDKMGCVLQYPRERLIAEGFPFKEKWRQEIFKNLNPIVLELGCGKGEYTVALAKSYRDKNFIGIDIKGARLWSGAREVEEEGMTNAFFLRTEIENLQHFFGHAEIDEIWITFADPQMHKPRKRLTSVGFLQKYSNILKDGGSVHLKTDSPFLYEYTRRVAEVNSLEIYEDFDDLYGAGKADPVTSIKTFYESQWLSRGKKIKLLSFKLPENFIGVEPPTDDIPKDDYRAYTRHTPIPAD